MEQIHAVAGKSQPVFSITKGGYARINKAFSKNNNIENVSFVELRGAKNVDKLEIGMRFLEKDEGNCIKITTDDRTGGKTFSLRSFFSHFGKYHKEIPKQKLRVTRQGGMDGTPIFVAEIKVQN